MNDEKRRELLEQIWNQQNQAYDLMCEYDAMPHRYGACMLYQAQAHMIDLIAQYPDITAADLAVILRKTPSACSQTLRKLREKGLVEQLRNAANNRQYKLQLTESGQALYRDHAAFSADCQQRTFDRLAEFTEEELALYLRVQQRINEAYADDVRRSREVFA
ncbi:MAG: MarR family transcriptional regulator [Fournierella sp.]|uniref:MarR family winged helix-turn-helix transcriptional regulator n=1 Tax=Allofournierella sp. TaxID=1940256 RepID=UPI002A8241B3|nr:MarR family transcriptional regulator [Fournierella sp.]MDY4166467.1 MarR family transcriptional regulator [Fournierella sp.]